MSELESDPWQQLRSATRARVGLGRAGDSLPTHRVLEFAADQALARDAIHTALDVTLLGTSYEPIVVDSAAPDRATYLTRPDLGRRLSPASRAALVGGSYDLLVVIADGLSASAVHAHALPLLEALLPQLEDWVIAPIVLARQGRVAIADEVGELLGAQISLVLIGERPGLSAPDSMGAYLTWHPRVGRVDSERNCVSNIRPPHGLSIQAGAETLLRLLVGAQTLQLSGVALKDGAGGLTA